MRSPVSRRTLGECNAITNQGFGPSELTFVSALDRVCTSHNRVCEPSHLLLPGDLEETPGEGGLQQYTGRCYWG
jgi:hypothetical protein